MPKNHASHSSVPKVKRLDYSPRSDLTADEKAIENDAGSYFATHLATLIPQYLRRFRHVVDRNKAQELYPAYAKNRESRQALSLATHEPAGALADQVYFSLVAKPAPPQKNLVLFNAGGQGSGKTTSLLLSGKVDRAFIVMDGTMQDYDKACRNIDLAFAHGKLVHINFVYCPFRKAVENIIRRASDVQGGRIVNVKRAAKGHFHALENIFKLIAKYDRKEGFSYSVVDNSGDKSQTITLDALRAKRYPSIDALERDGYIIIDGYFESFQAGDKNLTEGLHRRLKGK